jgi:flagellar P-ring protein FlgI
MKVRMKYMQFLLVFSLLITISTVCHPLSRIKDIVDFEGVRDNPLVGYGLVFGLNGTGDKLNSSIFTRESFIGIMERLGVTARDRSLNTKNIAAVMVTATLKPFARQGTKMDVHISTIGDATNLQGGTLVATPLKGADNEVYAVAQGPVAVPGFSAQGAAASITQGIPTNGRIPNGAIIEKEIEFSLNHQRHLRLFLRNPDFTTATRIRDVINRKLKGQGKLQFPVAQLVDRGTLSMVIPDYYQNRVSQMLSDIELLYVTPDQPARIIMNKSSGVIVMGEQVKINRVAIAHGSLTIKVTEMPQVSQPAPFAEKGTTVVVPRSEIEVIEGDKKLTIVKSGANLRDLVTNLNALGVSVQDIIEVMEAMKAAGAINAEVEVI